MLPFFMWRQKITLGGNFRLLGNPGALLGKRKYPFAWLFLSLVNRNGLPPEMLLQITKRMKDAILLFLLLFNYRWGLISVVAVLFIYLAWKFYAAYQKLAKNLQEVKSKYQNASAELKKAQSQLIQREKMASLGELTAGIAHEIQNPLNFVNNFAEVSAELLSEMEVEIDQGNPTEAKAIATDLKQNLEKINHHGKRASSIVKNMLEHSRTNSGHKELIDLNGLIDECMRLSYHGLRAQVKGFYADYELQLDPNLPKIALISQDIGRVLLNLFSNAFYAVHTKHKKEVAAGKAQLEDAPKVKASSMYTSSGVVIKISDNGAGIPQDLQSKIFQPFFTTKPTGEGTGLGLSLSYDIITKGHGGKVSVESTEGLGSTFIIEIPFQ